MLAAGLVEVFLGVDAEQKPLEEIAAPLSSVEGTTGSSSAPPEAGRAPVPRQRSGRSIWAPMPQASRYPAGNAPLAREVDALAAMLEAEGPLTAPDLARRAGARFWGPGRFRAAVRWGLASERICRQGRGRYAAARTTEGLWATEGPVREIADGSTFRGSHGDGGRAARDAVGERQGPQDPEGGPR
jgi:hypothetical protein